MTEDLEVNRPEVVDEITLLFEAYEAALVDKNIEVLHNTFWDSEHTIRYAMHENGYGFDEIHQHRISRKKGPGIKEERRRLEILTLGDRFATVNLEFKIRGTEDVGRQTQTWVKFSTTGWKVVTAHVSTMEKHPRW